jgi:hypothetical protein
MSSTPTTTSTNTNTILQITTNNTIPPRRRTSIPRSANAIPPMPVYARDEEEELNNNNNTMSPSSTSLNPTTTTTSQPTTNIKQPTMTTTAKKSSHSNTNAFLIPLVAGGGAGAISRTLMAPLERTKVLLQVQEVSLIPPQDRYKGIMDCLVRIPREQGFLAFWRGNGVNVARMIPNSAIKFTTYDTFKRWAFPKGEKSYSDSELYARKMLCGALSGISTIVPVYPMDVARTRLAADVSAVRKYNGFTDCLLKTIENEGIKGMYKGLGISVAGIIPYLAISLSLYDTMKDQVQRIENPRYRNFGESAMGLFLLGSISAVVSQTVAYPLDTVRRHMQVSGAIGQKNRYTGTWHCITKIYSSSGWKGFYRGVLANGVRAAPQTGIEFMFFDLIKSWLLKFNSE